MSEQGRQVKSLGAMREYGDYFVTRKVGGIPCAVWFMFPRELAEGRGPIQARVALKGHGIDGEPEWEITEHDDGTISLSPSLDYRLTPPDRGWHGWLEHGVWREV